MNEHLAEAEEEDIGECQGDTYTYVPSDTASSLLRGQGDPHDGQDKCGERQGETGILLNKSELYVSISSHLLRLDHIVEFLIVKRFHSLFRHIEVLDGQGKDRIHLASAADLVGKVLIVLSDEVFLQAP